jgi:hypothetical protein
MKKTLFWCIIALPFFTTSCKKDGGTPAPAVKFMSLTTGSIWNYKLTNNPSTTPLVSNYSVTASNRDTTINSKTYKVFTSTAATGNEYYNITGSDYYTFRKLPASLGGNSIEVLYLKDNLNTNETWTQSVPLSVTVSGFPLNLILTFNNKIAQKGITKIVNGITYNDAVDVETTLSITGIPVAYTLVTDIHYYYAPKVGQVENKTKIDFTVTGTPTTNFEQKTELESATIL